MNMEAIGMYLARLGLFAMMGTVVLTVPSGAAPNIDQLTPRNGFLSVLDYGAKGDAVHDDTSAFQKAIDAAGKNGGTVLVPPVGPGKGYVLTRTVTVPAGVVLMGSPAGLSSNAWSAYKLPEKHIVGAKIFARPRADQYNQPKKQPMFLLRGGSTVRGLWILYDRQPWPTDQEFQDPKSRFYYKTFEDARAKYIKEHVKPYGPTFYIPDATANIVVEDISCDRYYDFFYQAKGGRTFISRICCYGYKRAFVFGECLDVNRMSQLHCVPNVGPACPGTIAPDWAYTWIYGIVASQDDNIGVQMGRNDGFVFNDIFFFAFHTAVRYGASKQYPLHDPVTNTDSYYDPETKETHGFQSPYLGQGPWGDMVCFDVEACAIGLQFVWPSPQSNKISGARISTGIDDSRDFQATAGVGSLKDVGKQGAFVVEPSFCMANDAGYIPTLMCTNAFVASFTDQGRMGPPGVNADVANGRVFLIDGDATMDFTGFQTSYPYRQEMLCARGPHAGQVSIKIRGFNQTGIPSDDLKTDAGAITAGAR